MPGRGGWGGRKPVKHLSTVHRESGTNESREPTQSDYDRVTQEQSDNQFYEPGTLHDWETPSGADTVLSIWQRRVDFELGDVRRRAFFRRREVAQLSAYPAQVLEDAASSALRLNGQGNLLLAEWCAMAQDRMTGPRPSN